jgi:predicted transcriptional regulator
MAKTTKTKKGCEKMVDERIKNLANIISDYVINNQMSQEELNKAIDIVDYVYYTDGLIRRYEG